jgi:acetyl esterase/lipase
MAKVFAAAAVAAFLTLCVAGCAAVAPQPAPPSTVASSQYERVNANTTLLDVIDHPAFEGFGRFLFPTGRGMPDGRKTLRDAGDLLPYHRHVDVATTVDVVNSLMGSVERGQTVFYDIYTDEEKAADPSKKDTGLFFFRGRPNEPFAIASAGGGFSYVGSIHESLPHALELSRRGYNAFALQYRTGGAQVACEDLAAAISFVFRNAKELGVSTEGYSLWGGSAGARVAAYLGSRGSSAYGGADLPRPGVVIMQYTGHTDYTKQDPPTYACIGEKDGIANWRTMKSRLDALSAAGIDTEFHLYPDLGHGFGLGVGTSAEGWIDDAVAFWERHLER